jgi:hypothetical protein
MRYIPSSRYTLDEIAEQCKAAVNRAKSIEQGRTDLYTEVCKFHSMKDYGSLIH